MMDWSHQQRWRGRGDLWLALLVVVGISALLGSCANPVAPTGGPPDETPPSIVTTRPAQDSVNVPTSTQTIAVEFSEYIKRSTLTRALSITPSLDGRLQFDWSGRAVEIDLPSSLRDSTTYILSLSADLTDARGTSLDRPLTVAFSTGPHINQGTIDGRVVAPRRGQPQSRVDVYAYGLSGTTEPLSDSLPDRPAYRTQTGSDGTFSFGYLREQNYYVVALRDNNRNRTPDPQEAFAVPPHPALAADSGSAPVPVPWLLTTADTTAPTLRRVEPRSRKRLRLRFSEPVTLPDRAPADWTLRDSTAGTPVAVTGVYRPEDPNTVVLRTAPMEPTRHALVLGDSVVADTLGQPLRQDTARFRAAASPDTLQTRLEAFVPGRASADSIITLRPGEPPGVRFNQAPDSSVLRQGIRLQDTTGQNRPFTLATDDGRTYRLQPSSPMSDSMPVEVRVDGQALAGPDTTYRRRFQRMSRDRLGALEGRVILADTTHSSIAPTTAETDSVGRGTLAPPERAVRVETRPTQDEKGRVFRQLRVAPGSTFVVQELPEAKYRFRAFWDWNENGRWDGGTIQPFRRAEPVTWSKDATKLRPRWTSVLSAPLRIPILEPPSTETDTTTPPR
ncbi:MAG: hypothetical protein BRD55_02050 [Bacteroidetes bacterium SW_9_63_38]|nr:MAG: hypothetical protein BRD55_02050 [Bacteroidetes bacterium SW_9_63_38]